MNSTSMKPGFVDASAARRSPVRDPHRPGLISKVAFARDYRHGYCGFRAWLPRLQVEFFPQTGETDVRPARNTRKPGFVDASAARRSLVDCDHVSAQISSTKAELASAQVCQNKVEPTIAQIRPTKAELALAQLKSIISEPALSSSLTGHF